MKCLIVTTHPLENSLCKFLTKQLVDNLKAMGHEVTIEDLYTQDFKPILTIEERESYYTTHYNSSDVASQVDRLQKTEALILLFPTWWFGFPAMLKGWFDRVWGPGIAYNHASDFGPIKPLLNNLNQVLVITTLGAPWWVDWLIMWQPVKRIMKIALLGTCAKNSKLNFLSLYQSEKLTPQKIEKFSHKIKQVLERWKK